MNIFILDLNVKKAAEYHNDKHVVKMILETAQLLCTAHWINGSEAPYKKTHHNHPSAVWARESMQNYIWLCRLGLALCREFTYRFEKVHKTEQVIKWCLKNVPNLPKTGMTDFALAMPVEYKLEDAVESYRVYYNNDKKHLAKWTKRQKPEWYEQKE
jgi:hypothetical protein